MDIERADQTEGSAHTVSFCSLLVYMGNAVLQLPLRLHGNRFDIKNIWREKTTNINKVV